MQTGFKIHKQAVLLEYNLNTIVAKAKREPYSTLADISILYEQPVHMMRKILLQIQQEQTLSIRDKWMIQMIQARYQPYEDCLLKQLDEMICYAMCKDLEALHQEMMQERNIQNSLL